MSSYFILYTKHLQEDLHFSQIFIAIFFMATQSGAVAGPKVEFRLAAVVSVCSTMTVTLIVNPDVLCKNVH
jgi:hypothetical protein